MQSLSGRRSAAAAAAGASSRAQRGRAPRPCGAGSSPALLRAASHACRASAAQQAGAGKAAVQLNVIEKSAWANGVPPVMGAHLMASGVVAPISQSTGAGEGVAEPTFHYPAGEANESVVVYATARNAAAGLAKAVTEAAAAAIKAKGSFTLVLSGGSLVNMLSSIAEVRGIDFSKWWVFWADERNVPLDSADSNYRGAQEALLGRVGIPAEQVFAIHEGLPVEQAATNYEGRLVGLPPSVLPCTPEALPVFDLVLLGVGPDGHVASLFPNTPATAATSGWVLPVSSSPKPPPERITLTLPAINAAKEVLVVAVGESKAEIVQRCLEVQALPGALPAQMVRPSPGRVRWLLDAMSAQELRLEEWESGKGFPRNV